MHVTPVTTVVEPDAYVHDDAPVGQEPHESVVVVTPPLVDAVPVNL